MSDTLNFSVSFRGSTHRISLDGRTPLSVLQAQIQKETGVPPELQKLIYKGKKAQALGEDTTITDAGIKEGVKIQLLGTTAQELDGMKAVESERERRERIMKERAMKPQYKVRSTGPSGRITTLSTPSTSGSSYKFHEIVPLAHLPDPPQARATLEKLANDPAVQHVMNKHQFTVGTLTELAPHEHPNLLGLNVNAGQAIKLRVYTDRYDGFRSYKEIRRVLCHELAHNVWGEHDNNFKELNSLLNREIAEFERAGQEGAHTLSGSSVGGYMPSSEAESDAAQSYTLGGSSQTFAGESAEERRRRVLEATMSRLKKEEEDIEHSCGTGN